uniref:Uncharacterized protein n=1 Tax=Helianthus annuus TaxID=4232 RepID=A0A251VMF0_HELAN
MLLVFLLTLGDVVDENNDELVEIGFAHPVHKIHEDCRRVRKPEWHDKKLVMTVASSESGFGDVLIPDSQLMIP